MKLVDKASRRERRYHATPECLRAGAYEAETQGPELVVAGFYHTRACGDPAAKMGCRGGCFAVDETSLATEEGAH